MSFLDDAAGYADKASGILDAATGGSGSGAQGAAPAPGAAPFVKGEALSNDSTQGGSSAPTPDGSGPPVAIELGIPIEFIHFGFVHADTGKSFPHDCFNPESAAPPPDNHAMMFRDALEREAILLFGFVSSCKVAVQDATKGRSAIEEIGAMASNLLGGGSTIAKPDPAQLDAFISKIKSQVETINKAQIEYKDVHEAGKQFHQIRNDYATFCNSLDAFYLKPPKSEGIGAIGHALGSAAASIPGVGKVIAVAQRIAFKMLDLYLAAFLELRKNHEKTIEVVVHKLTIDAIKGKYQWHAPIYPVWFKKPEATNSGTDASGGSGSGSSTPGFLRPVTSAIDSANSAAEGVRDTIYDFAGASGSPEQTPGSGALTAAFSALKGGNDTAQNTRPGAADCIIAGLDATLSDIGGVPNFLKTVIREIMAGNLALLEDVFARLMTKDASEKIDSQMLLAGGRRYLTQKITKALTSLIVGMITGGVQDFTLNVPGGKTLSAQQLLAKQMDERLGKFVEPVLQLCIGDLAGQLEASRKKASDEKAQTMEVLLGRLPWLVAMMFRNTFFPVWNLVAEEVLGQISPPLKSALKAINSPLNKAKDAIDKGQEYKRRAEKTKDEASSMNVSVGNQQDLQDVKNAATNETDEGRRRREEREAAENQKQNLDAFYQENDKDKDFPVASRVAEGAGLKVEEEIPSVLPATA